MNYVEQILSSILVNILALGAGASLGITNILISENQEDPLQNRSNTAQSNISQEFGLFADFSINTDQQSWIGSFGVIGQYFPIFVVGPVIAKFGKRISLMSDCVLFTIGFLLMACSVEVQMLYAAKFIFGYAYLNSRSSIQPFICEISDTSVRGFTTTLWLLFFIIGISLSLLASSHLGWRYVSGFSAALMLLCFVGLSFIHETPESLLENREFERAVKALKFYKTDKKLLVVDDNKRKSQAGEDRSYEDLVKLYRIESKKHPNCGIENDDQNEIATKVLWKDRINAKITRAKATFGRPEIYKPFCFLIVVFGLLELSGCAVLANYSVIMVENFGYGSKTFVTPETMMTIINLIRIPVSFLAITVLQKFKKRPLYLTVCLFIFVVVSGIIAFTHAVEIGYLEKTTVQGSIGLQLVPFILLILFYSGFSFGFANIPFSLMGELFPSSVANFASTTILVLVNTIELVAVKTALLIKDEHGLQYTFVIPAISILCSAIFAALFMPETHGLTRKEIGNIYAEGEKEVIMDNEPLPYFSSLRGSEGTINAMEAIHQFSSRFIAPEELSGVVLARRICKPSVSFRSRAQEVLQKTSVVSAFQIKP